MALPLLSRGSVEPARIPIAIVLTSFHRGGTERQMTELIRRLDPARFEVHVVCIRQEGPWLARVRETAVSLSEFRLGSFCSPTAVRQLIRFTAWLRDRRIVILQACDLYANVFALPAAALARVPVRIGSRRGIVSPMPTPGLLALQRGAYRAAQSVVANSGAAAARLRTEGLREHRIAIIPNGIDVTAFAAAGRQSPPRIITTVANLRPGKGHDVLLRAAVEVLRAHPDVRFQLVGDGPLRETLEQQAAALGVGTRVAFLGNRDDVTDILQTTDIFAFPSLMEAFPNSVMEAMATGLPVVATRVGGIPELVEHGRTGLLVPASDHHALAAALSRIIADRGLADALALAAREYIRTQYSFDRMVSAFEQLYLEHMRARAPAPVPRLPLHKRLRLHR